MLLSLFTGAEASGSEREFRSPIISVRCPPDEPPTPPILTGSIPTVLHSGTRNAPSPRTLQWSGTIVQRRRAVIRCEHGLARAYEPKTEHIHRFLLRCAEHEQGVPATARNGNDT